MSSSHETNYNLDLLIQNLYISGTNENCFVTTSSQKKSTDRYNFFIVTI